MKIDAIREVTIIKTHNWYVVQTPKEHDEGIEHNVVFQINNEKYEESEAEQRALREVFYHLKEYFGVYYSKHNDTNLSLNIEKFKKEDEDDEIED